MESHSALLNFHLENGQVIMPQFIHFIQSGTVSLQFPWLRVGISSADNPSPAKE
jgi:hypothetical protein